MDTKSNSRNPNLNFNKLDEIDPNVSHALFQWTGKPPQFGVCPGVGSDGILRSLPQLKIDKFTRQDLRDYFDNSWTLTECLFTALTSEEAFYTPPYHHLRHPLIFYFGHPATLYINKLRLAGLIEDPINPDFELLFETGVDEMSWDDMSKNQMKWPTVATVSDYRKKVYKVVCDLIDTHPALDPKKGPITQNSPGWALVMGFEHERIHLETSSVLMRELPLSFLRTPQAWPSLAPLGEIKNKKSQVNNFISVPATQVQVGKPADWPTFGWDNEYGKREANVTAFSATENLITNGEYYDFVSSNGYQEPRFWGQEGWKWRQFRNSKWPTFWVPNGPSGLHAYKLRSCFEVIDMPWSWPVEVNFFEAKAYCRWRSEKDKSPQPYRLLTENEHHSLRQGLPKDLFDGSTKFNLNLKWSSPSPVGESKLSKSPFSDVFGNVWQWCEDDFHPLENFQAHAYYSDFSLPCYDGEHSMILGGSFISTGHEASYWARFHFRPHFFQHAGFRMVQPTEDEVQIPAVKVPRLRASEQVYETHSILNEYLLLHFGSAKEQMPYEFGPKDAVGFPRRCAELVIKHAQNLKTQNLTALDVGCAVGGSTFELARHYKSVIGIDLSSTFVTAAQTLKREGSMDYPFRVEGSLSQKTSAQVPDDIDRERTSFERGDACALSPELKDFDAVLMTNLLCRLPNPRLLLSRLTGPQGLVKPGGLAVIVSPYSWLDNFTKKEFWLGGFENKNQPVRAKDTLFKILEPNFELIDESDMPLLIREHTRKFQYIVSHAMVWRRKS